MTTQNIHRRHLAPPRFSLPHLRPKPAEPAHHRHPSAYQVTNRFERSMDLLIVAMVIVLAVAMVWGLLTATGHPAYFDRYWVSVWRHTTA